MNSSSVLSDLGIAASRYSGWSDLTSEQQSSLVKHFAIYYPERRKIKWRCCGSQSLTHTDSSKEIAKNCFYIRNNGVPIDDAVDMLGFPEHRSVRKQRVSKTIPQTPVSVNEVEELKKEFERLRVQVEAISRSTPLASKPSSPPPSPLYPPLSPTYGQPQTIEEVCLEVTGRNLFPASSTTPYRCRWPVYERNTRTFQRCSRNCNSDGQVCSQHSNTFMQ